MPSILLTGSEGNIGTYVWKALEARYPDARIVRVAHHGNETGGIFVGDLTDDAFVRRLFSEQDITHVVHLAARTYNAIGFKKDAFGLIDNDARSLLSVLRAATKVEKFVYLSSALVYESSTDAPFTEDQTERMPPPSSAYGITKLFGERVVKAYGAQFGIPYTIWRPFNVVSPLEPHDRDGGHVFVDFYRKLFVEHASTLPIFGNGQQIRCFTWVEDIADAIAAFLYDPRTDNEAFNIGSSETKTLFELKDALVDIGKTRGLLDASYDPKIETGETFGGVDTGRRIPSLDKIRDMLGWEAPTGFRACFERFILAKQS